MDQKLYDDIERFAAENEENIIRDIGRLVAVYSVEGPAEEGAPFGKGPAAALKLALQIAEELGLDSVNCEDMIGYAGVGSAEKYLATITHLDTVPAGEGWTGDPFTLREREGYLIGRGVMDDKGPSILSLYALRFLKEHGIPLRYSVRALLGINEETGMKDVEHYLKNYPAPVFCFSPDSGFPVCNGEKGICRGSIKSRLPLGNVVDIRGGIAANVIPGKAEAWIKGACPKPAEKVSVEADGELWHLTASGIGGHASKPEGTENAIGILINYILDNVPVTPEEEKIFSLLKLLHDSWDGSGLGVEAADGIFDPLTIIGGVIGVEDGHVFQSFDSRYTTNTNAERIAEGIRAKAGDAAEVIVSSDDVPFYMSPDSPAVKICMDIYNNITGSAAKPYTMGGGTYAREFPNAVAFGPEHPERTHPAFAGPIHGADEAASMAELLEALKIYIITLTELEKLDF